METDQLYLFRDKRFLPLFITQFCGCFNDNLLKNALTILITYKLAGQTFLPAALMILMANAVFISPFILFAGIAGQLADKFERSKLVKIIKIAELGIVLLAMYGFYHTNLIVLYTCLGLMGIHSTFFGPLKYSIIPDHLAKDEILGGNGFVEAGTFVSILIGTILGGLYTAGADFVLYFMLLTSATGIISSWFLPESGNAKPELEINTNIFEETCNILKYSYHKKPIFLSILGISWFWFIGAALLSQIPSLTKDTFGADENVANLFLATFSIGVGVGSFWCNKLFENEITTKYVFTAAIGVSLFGLDLFFASGISAVRQEPEQLKSITVFLSKLHNWRILVDLFFLSALSGLYVVPLFAVMQYFSSSAYRSRVIAANNLVNSIFMIASTVMLSILFALEFKVQTAILTVSVLNLVVAIYIYHLLPEIKIVPEPIVRWFFRFVFSKLYRVEVRGLENFQKAGKRAVIIVNHLSYIDPPLIGAYLPEKFTFAIDAEQAQVWWVKPFLNVGKCYPIDRNNPMAIKSLIDEIKKNKKIVIFPEGRISVTGSLMKVYEGPGLIADKAGAPILPIRVDGTQYTMFSKLKNLPKRSFFPKITITILPPVELDVPKNVNSRERRKYLGQKLYDIMSDMMFESSDYKKTLFQSLIDAGKIHGFNKQIILDMDGSKLTYRQLLTKSFALGDVIARYTHINEHVGLMLPNTTGASVTFFAMQAYSRIPTMINFTSGVGTITSACNTAKVKTIFTSRKFIEKAGLDELAQSLEQRFNVIYLEDLKSKISLIAKLRGFMGGLVPHHYYQGISLRHRESEIRGSRANDKTLRSAVEEVDSPDTKPAVILFTSGTEGQPKAVVLSHRNIQANRCQTAARLDFNAHDIAFNTLPIFHTFGMTGMVLMLLQGIRSFCYPSPLDYRAIPEVMYDVGATILFTTDTFLNGYAKYAHPYDFYSLRYVFAGAEKLKAETRRLWLEKYGVRVFEGYGATEAAPVISVNTSMYERHGTVGRLLPKIDYRLQPLEGIEEGGALCIKGPNIMLGYISADNPGVIVPPYAEGLGEGWYNTGDVASIDDEGYVRILGRIKRFAKISGEMVSLAAVEEIANALDQGALNVAVQANDEKKGEHILLFTTSKDVNREALLAEAVNQGVSKLHIPKTCVLVESIPTLATGKIDYPAVAKMAEAH